MTASYMQVTEDEVLRLLGIIAAIDLRSWADTRAVRATAVSWWQTIQRELDQRRHFTLGYKLAEDAVYAWYGRDRRRITPADLIDMAAEIREERLARTTLPDPPDHPAVNGWRDDLQGWEAMHRAGQDVLAAGGSRDDAGRAMTAVARQRPRELDRTRP